MRNAIKAIERMLEKRVSIPRWIGAFLGIVFLRTLTEQYFAKTVAAAPYEIVLEYIHNLLFFSIAFLSLWIIHAWLLRKNPAELSFVFLCASFLILCPPLIDMLKTGGETYWSFYTLGSLHELRGFYLSLMGNLPPGVKYFGTRITFLSAIVLLAGFVLAVSRKPAKAALSAVLSYTIFALMGGFPSLFTMAYLKIAEGKPFLENQGFNAAQLFGSAQKLWGLDFRSLRFSFVYKLDFVFYLILIALVGVLAWMVSRKKWLAMAKNSRYPQLVYHAGLFFIGMGLGISKYPSNFSIGLFPVLSVLVLVAGIWLAWLASVVPNDLNDRVSDEVSNPERPIPAGVISKEEYAGIGILFFALSLLGGLIVGFEFFFLLLAYQILAWFYSSPPFRLKRYPVVASFASALASLMIFYMGFVLMADGQDIHGIPMRIVWLLLIAYTLSLPVKDLKDIEGDRKAGILTVPVIFGEKKGRIIIGSGIFLSFVLSVFMLNDRRLFLWALLFGAASYWVVQKKDIDPRRIFWWILPIVIAYGLMMVLIMFVN